MKLGRGVVVWQRASSARQTPIVCWSRVASSRTPQRRSIAWKRASCSAQSSCRRGKTSLLQGVALGRHVLERRADEDAEGAGRAWHESQPPVGQSSLWKSLPRKPRLGRSSRVVGAGARAGYCIRTPVPLPGLRVRRRTHQLQDVDTPGPVAARRQRQRWVHRRARDREDERDGQELLPALGVPELERSVSARRDDPGPVGREGAEAHPAAVAGQGAAAPPRSARPRA